MPERSSGTPQKDNQAGSFAPPQRSPQRSLLDIVLCYILHDPRFWGLLLVNPLPLGLPLPGAGFPGEASES